jgi:hypothetical protein
MSAIRLTGSTSGYAEITPSAIAGDVQLVLPSTAGTLDRLNRAGNILQVVNATYSTTVSNSTNVYADTGLAASITPTSSSSKILVVVDQTGCAKLAGNINSGMDLRLLRDATTLAVFGRDVGYTGVSDNSLGFNPGVNYLDSPSTTSSITYKTQFMNVANAALVRVQEGGSVSTITLMEIAA